MSEEYLEVKDFSKYNTGDELGVELGARKSKWLFKYYVNAVDLNNDAFDISDITQFKKKGTYRVYIPLELVEVGHIIRVRKDKEVEYWRIEEKTDVFVRITKLSEEEARKELESKGIKFKRLRKKWITLEEFYKRLYKQQRVPKEVEDVKARELKIGDKFKLGGEEYKVETKTQKYVGLANGEVIKVKKEQTIQIDKGSLKREMEKEKSKIPKDDEKKFRELLTNKEFLKTALEQPGKVSEVVREFAKRIEKEKKEMDEFLKLGLYINSYDVFGKLQDRNKIVNIDYDIDKNVIPGSVKIYLDDGTKVYYKDWETAKNIWIKDNPEKFEGKTEKEAIQVQKQETNSIKRYKVELFTSLKSIIEKFNEIEIYLDGIKELVEKDKEFAKFVLFELGLNIDQIKILYTGIKDVVYKSLKDYYNKLEGKL